MNFSRLYYRKKFPIENIDLFIWWIYFSFFFPTNMKLFNCVETNEF